jgi:hypothetical protein
MTDPKGSKDELDEQEQATAPLSTDPVSASASESDRDSEDANTSKSDASAKPEEAEKRTSKEKATRPSKGRAAAEASSKTSASSTRQKAKPRGSGGSRGSSSRSTLVVAVTLIVGVGVGWFAHEARAMVLLRQQEAAAEAGEGPCQGWQQQVCEGAGAKSLACSQAKDVVKFLPTAACGAALDDVAGTLEKLKAARADCNKLVSKLCKDLGEDTATCKMVTERTESFPAERCTQMLKSYDQVLNQLKRMEQQAGMGAPRHPGASPHGAPRPGPARAQSLQQSIPPVR